MPLTMYDDIRLDLIPVNAPAVAGYVDGLWPTFPLLAKRFPKAHRLSIAVTSNADADCLDVEPGDATNAVAPAWVKRQQARGVKRPVVYTSVSNAATLLATLAGAGVPRSAVRLWTAHYTGKAHLCGPACGFGLRTNADATQWDDHALGRSLDISLCRDGFFGASVKVQITGTAPAAKKRRIWRQHLARTDALLAALRAKAALLARLIARKK